MKKQLEKHSSSNTGIQISPKKPKPQPSDDELIDKTLSLFSMLINREQHNNKPPIYFDGTNKEE